MKNYIAVKFIGVGLLYWLTISLAIANEHVLTLGIIPYVSPNKLIQHNLKFVHFLEKNIGVTITIITAPDFNAFVRRTKNKEYDLIFTAPHHGRYAELNDGYQRIAMTKHNIQGYYLVSKDSSFKNIQDLQGKTLTTTPAITLLTQLVFAQLQQHGLSNTDLTIINTTTHSNAIHSVLNNESDSAVTGIKIWQRLNQKNRNKLRVLDKTIKVPGFILLGKKTLAPDMIKKLQSLALIYHSDASGQSYPFKGFKKINDTDMQGMDPYIKVFNFI